MTERLTEEQVDKVTEELKEKVEKRSRRYLGLDTCLYTTQKLAEYRAKKARNRKRNKMQKASRKANR